jgi:hypothetical protein
MTSRLAALAVATSLAVLAQGITTHGRLRTLVGQRNGNGRNRPGPT